ncbi:hypothetical protein BG617_15440 [Lactiplantibacillus paraplantarum]|nr:hypothetical protein BG617_15440 [Lactiplantibacillus paraplantarum]
MEGKRGSECLLKSVSNIDFNPLNKKIKRKTKAKEQFPNEKSLDNFIGVQVISYNEKNFNRIHRGFGQVKDTLESLFD